MNKEIDEILDYISDRVIQKEKWNKVRDYITNLQEENELLKKHNEKLYKKDSGIIENLNQELERTQQKWEEERQFTICRTKEWLDYKSRIDKAVEYIENDNNLWVPLGEDCGRPDKDLEELLNILRGNNDI